jgi:hypothetical protein
MIAEHHPCPGVLRSGGLLPFLTHVLFTPSLPGHTWAHLDTSNGGPSRPKRRLHRRPRPDGKRAFVPGEADPRCRPTQGALAFRDADGELIKAFAHGDWSSVEMLEDPFGNAMTCGVRS